MGVANLGISGDLLLLSDLLIILGRHDVTLLGRHAMIVEKVADDTLKSHDDDGPVLHVRPPLEHVSEGGLVSYRRYGLQLLGLHNFERRRLN